MLKKKKNQSQYSLVDAKDSAKTGVQLLLPQPITEPPNLLTPNTHNRERGYFPPPSAFLFMSGSFV